MGDETTGCSRSSRASGDPEETENCCFRLARGPSLGGCLWAKKGGGDDGEFSMEAWTCVAPPRPC